jgi:hypothetical protein
MEGSWEYTEQEVVGNQKRGCPPACGLNEGLIIPHRQKPVCYEMLHNGNRMACADQINLAQDREKWRAVVSVVINRELHNMPGIATPSYNLIDSQEGI